MVWTERKMRNFCTTNILLLALFLLLLLFLAEKNFVVKVIVIIIIRLLYREVELLVTKANLQTTCESIRNLRVGPLRLHNH